MTSEELPEPLLSSSVKTGSMGSMLLDFSRLINSDFFALSTGDEFKAAVAIWAAAWSQTPAGSLPSDERILASLSRAKNWKKVREMALHGFILCSDDRYYHRVLCEKALEVSKKIEEFSKKSEKNLQRKQKERSERAELLLLAAELNLSADNSMTTTQLRELIEDSKNLCDFVTRDIGVTECDSHAHVTHTSRCIKEKKLKGKENEIKLKEIKSKSLEQEPRALKSQDQDQDQEQKPKACAAEPLAAGAAVSLENLEDENLNRDSTTDDESATHDLSKKAVSKRGKAQKSTSGGIDLSNLPQQISAMAAEAVIAMRKSRRNPFVQISFDRFMARVLEASAEIGISADDVIFEIIDAGWMGFRIDWLKARLSTTQKSGAYKSRFSDLSAADKTTARSLEYADFLTDQMASGIAGAVTIDAIAVGD